MHISVKMRTKKYTNKNTNFICVHRESSSSYQCLNQGLPGYISLMPNILPMNEQNCQQLQHCK